MKIVVTGANGYLGRGIIKQLLDDHVQVTAVDFNCDQVDERAERITADLFQIQNPFEYFGKPDCLLHLAWRDGFQHNAKSHMEDLPKHYQFIKDLVEGGLKKISVLGSMHEIGFYEGAIQDDTPANPQTLYGISKNALRQAVAYLADSHGVSYQWIRGFYIVSNTNVGSSIFSKIVQSVEAGKTIFPFTTGVNQYDFLDYEEFCIRAAAIVEQTEINGIVNCCSGWPERLSTRVESFIRENQYDIQLEYGAYPDRPYDSKAVWGDDRKINIILQKKEDGHARKS